LILVQIQRSRSDTLELEAREEELWRLVSKAAPGRATGHYSIELAFAHEYLLGPLSQVVSSHYPTIKRGFPTHCILLHRYDILQDFTGHPAWATVECLNVHGIPPTDAVLALLMHPAMRSLHSLEQLSTELAILLLGRYPRSWKRLHLQSRNRSAALSNLLENTQIETLEMDRVVVLKYDSGHYLWPS
jgi:hypothetical protein